MLQAYPKRSKDALSPHFRVSEFACPCTNPQCSETKVDKDLVDKLEKVRAEVKTPLRISSGYRCAHYQAELRSRGYETANGISQHELGRAADVTGANAGITGETLEKAARKAGFESVGVGGLWIHVDLRPGYRRWVYAKR